LAVPFETIVLGVPVMVERVDLNQREEIVAVCRGDRVRQTVCRLPSRREHVTKITSALDRPGSACFH